MKTVISASRRTDLAAVFPEWLAAALHERRARVVGPSGGNHEVDLAPESVHTLVLWSKDFSRVLRNEHGLRGLLLVYDQLYFHFTVTGLGGTAAEPGTPGTAAALAQIGPLVELAGDPRRISLRFDPVLFWRDGQKDRTNIGRFARIAAAAACHGIRDIRTSFAQWYPKARSRAARRSFDWTDPPETEKRALAAAMAVEARALGLRLHACCQPLLAGIEGIQASACIDGGLLRELHPRREPVSLKKDGTQRGGCGCTESRDIGSYTQACPHGCVYCYANPRA